MRKQSKLSDFGIGGLADEFKRIQSDSLALPDCLSSHYMDLERFALHTSEISSSMSSLASEYSRELEAVASNARRMLRLLEPSLASAAAAATAANSGLGRWVNEIAQQYDFRNSFEALASSIARADIERIAEAIGTLPTGELQKIADELRASTAIDALMAGAFKAEGILHLNQVPEAIRGIVESRLPEVGAWSGAQTVSAPSRESAAPDYAWAAWLKQQSPPVQILVYFLIFFVLQGFVGEVLRSVGDKWLRSTSQEARSQLVIEIQQNLGTGSISGLRCVRGKGVSVREAPSKDARTVGKLSAGQASEVVEAQGAFTHIRYRDTATGETREGWAASGYLVNVAC